MQKNNDLWRKAILSIDSSIEQGVGCLNNSALKIALVVDSNGHLVGTLSDGDIRRSLLKGLSMQSPIINSINIRPLIVPSNMPRNMVLQLMLANKVQQIPVVDDHMRLLGLHVWDDYQLPSLRENAMVIMAGGRGIRLMPHTKNCPKPMVLVDGKPILEHIIIRAIAEGFNHFFLATHYLSHIIEDHFGDGGNFGVRIEYLKEDSPLGTAGALGLLPERPKSSFVVTNGDVISAIKYSELLDFHLLHEGAATMAVQSYEMHHQFGVVKIEGIEISGFEEKPVYRTNINAGIYVLSPDALKEIKLNEPIDMPTLFEKLRAKGGRTLAYPLHESWIDIGRTEDLVRANKINAKR